jgi:hypothetical protein
VRDLEGSKAEATSSHQTCALTSAHRWKSQVISAADVVGPTANITQFPHAHLSGSGGSRDPLLLLNQLSLSLESESS